jgi:polar amino acid transport system substrate-binding protein
VRNTLFIALGTFLLLSFSGPVSAIEEISFTTVNWEPYSGEFLAGYGVGSAIIEEACLRVGLKATFRFLPWKRAMEEVKRGKYDALFSAYFSEKRSQVYGVSKAYMSGPLVLAVRKGAQLAWDGTVRSLEPYRIGVVRGYVNTEEIDKADFLIKDEATSDLLNLKKLLGKRIDVIVIDKYTAIHLLKSNSTLEGNVQDIEFLDPPLDMRSIHVMFSKNMPDWEKHLEMFNAGLSAIQEDGTKDIILEKYGFK